jgi:hypothetical protein
MKNLIYNAIRTPDGTILESRHRHDYRTYTDANGETYMVDGGLSYLRRGITVPPYEELSRYDTEPHDVQREVMAWGTYGINGDQPISYVKIKDMSTAHLEAVLKNCDHISPVFLTAFNNELELRKQNDLDPTKTNQPDRPTE